MKNNYSVFQVFKTELWAKYQEKQYKKKDNF